MSGSYTRVRDWLASSGLIVTDAGDDDYGGVYSHFDQDGGRYGFLYPEIAGYCTSAFSFLHRKEGNVAHLDVAEANSAWLEKILKRYGAIVQGSTGQRELLAYTFDAAVCAKGLLDYHLAAGSTESLKCAKRLVDWLYPAINDDGTLMPFMELESGEFVESDDVWYNKKGSHHVKVAMALVGLHEATGDDTLLEDAIRICDAHEGFLNPDGSIRLHHNKKTTNLHTQCYALEGLLYTYAKTGNERYLDRCRRCLEWCAQKINGDGSIDLWFDSRHKSRAVYPAAQIMRLMILVDKADRSDVFKPYVGKLAEFVSDMQASDSDIRVDGGMYEELYRSVLGWKKRMRLNSWTSMFVLQAMYWHDNYDMIRFDSEIASLY